AREPAGWIRGRCPGRVRAVDEIGLAVVVQVGDVGGPEGLVDGLLHVRDALQAERLEGIGAVLVRELRGALALRPGRTALALLDAVEARPRGETGVVLRELVEADALQRRGVRGDDA